MPLSSPVLCSFPDRGCPSPPLWLWAPWISSFLGQPELPSAPVWPVPRGLSGLLAKGRGRPGRGGLRRGPSALTLWTLSRVSLGPGYLPSWVTVLRPSGEAGLPGSGESPRQGPCGANWGQGRGQCSRSWLSRQRGAARCRAARNPGVSCAGVWVGQAEEEGLCPVVQGLTWACGGRSQLALLLRLFSLLGIVFSRGWGRAR